MEVVERAQRHNEDDGPLTISIDLKLTFEREEEFAAAIKLMEANMKGEDWDNFW
jgi:hypothetical protein